MVTKEEIERIARLMRLELDDHLVHIDRIQEMIDYFGILDGAGVEDDELAVNEVPASRLRDDEHIQFDGDLLEYIKGRRGRYVRAPRMD